MNIEGHAAAAVIIIAISIFMCKVSQTGREFMVRANLDLISEPIFMLTCPLVCITSSNPLLCSLQEDSKSIWEDGTKQ